MSASTAKIVLSTKRLRWSSPTEFNDPFDVPRELGLHITPKKIMEAIVERQIYLFKNLPDDLTGYNSKFKTILDALKNNNEPELVDEFITSVRGILEEESPSSFSLDQYRKYWDELIPEMRILCLSESYSKTSMWNHYADGYKGAVIEFLCDDELDSAWKLAKPINYSDDAPFLSTAEGWAKMLMLTQEAAANMLFDVSMYSKSLDWAYEGEWRISSFKRPDDKGSYTDYGFNEKEVGNLYLGPFMEPEAKAALIYEAKNYRNMNVIESFIGNGRNLSFTPINC